MSKGISALSAVLALLAAAASSASPPAAAHEFHLASTIAFNSTRDHVDDDPALTPPLVGAEVYLINPDGTNPRRLTNNAAFDGFANLSADGKKIAFDSTRYTGALNVSDVFVMNTDGTEQAFLAHGSSATWSPDSKNIAFHASASGAGTPTRTDPGSAMSDSDIFVANLDDLLAGSEQPTNITNNPSMIDDDPDWSPDGQTILFTSHPVTDDPRFSNQTELYLMNVDGTGLRQLTNNEEEERAAAWSPDGTRIVYSARVL